MNSLHEKPSAVKLWGMARKNKVEKQGFTFPLWFKVLFWLGVAGFVSGVLLVSGVLYYYSRQVPDFRTLADYKPSQITRIYAHDGQILAEYARERRIYTPIQDIPKALIQTYLAAEDTGFYQHMGFDPKAIVRAALVNILTHRRQGASTITQQVAKTFLLSREQTYTRKIKELILSWRIEHAFTKDEILELYLNQIYLGNGAYGVAAAAQSYFGKTLDELSLGERALLAGLPKAPSRYNPVRNPQRAKARRDVVIRRMEAEGFISTEEADAAILRPLVLAPTALKQSNIAPHFSEHVRRQILEKYNEDVLYHGGLKIYTTLDLHMQEVAEKELYEGLRNYDRRHGWRGPVGNMPLLVNWSEKLQEEEGQRLQERMVGDLAVVLEVKDDENYARIGLTSGEEGALPLEGLTWARLYRNADTRGPKVKQVSQVLNKGDIIYVRPLKGKTVENAAAYGLEQIPAVQGALVAIDVRTGAVRALVGGLGDGSGFNRAIQSRRQVGSAFKPFVYMAALESGMTPATSILDAPVVFREEKGAWKPSNYSSRIYGPSTLRRGLEKSRNLMTIRLGQEIGMPTAVRAAQRAGLDTTNLSMSDLTVALGSGAFSLLDMVSAYSSFPNGGRRVPPYFVSRIQDASGASLFRKHNNCQGCTPLEGVYELATPPHVEVTSQRVTSPQIAYQMVSLLQGVVQRGTARRQRHVVGRPAGGKTGTTNDYKDAWFIGFTPSLVVGVWVGFDVPQTLGHGEAGGGVAGPIWGQFMKQVLQNKPVELFQVPDGISFVRIDQDTGTLPTLATKHTLLEAFIEGTEPKPEDQPVQPKVEESTITPAGLF